METELSIVRRSAKLGFTCFCGTYSGEDASKWIGTWPLWDAFACENMGRQNIGSNRFRMRIVDNEMVRPAPLPVSVSARVHTSMRPIIAGLVHPYIERGILP